MLVLRWLVCFLAFFVLSGHMKLVLPVPRSSPDPDTQDLLDSGGLEESPPCGDTTLIPPGAPTAVWEAGSEVEVRVDNIVEHSGVRFEILVSFDGEQTFHEALEPASSLPGTMPYVLGGVPAQGQGLHRITIRLPPLGSSAATVRVFDNFAYFSCADVAILPEIMFQSSFEDGLIEWDENIPGS